MSFIMSKNFAQKFHDTIIIQFYSRFKKTRKNLKKYKNNNPIDKMYISFINFTYLPLSEIYRHVSN